MSTSLPHLLEPVDEVADEEAANYAMESNDILADVSMVDPQVQLFDDNNDNGEDGGAADEQSDDDDDEPLTIDHLSH